LRNARVWRSGFEKFLLVFVYWDSDWHVFFNLHRQPLHALVGKLAGKDTHREDWGIRNCWFCCGNDK
jgi:hypothetical protein